jgi:hypothetical protein
VQDELVNVSGGLEFLQAVGFQLVFDEADGYSPPAPIVHGSANPRLALTCLASIALHWSVAEPDISQCPHIHVASSAQVCSAARG